MKECVITSSDFFTDHFADFGIPVVQRATHQLEDSFVVL